MITTNIVFDHRNRTIKGKEGPLEVRLIIDRKPIYINTGVRVRREEWKFGTIIDRPDSVELNERLRIIIRKIEEEVNRCIDEGVAINVAEVRRRINMVKESDEYDFYEWAMNEAETRIVSDDVKKHYSTLLMALLRFGRMLTWNNVSVENILEFDKWLHNQRKPLTQAQILMGAKPQKLTDGTIYNYHKNLKALLNTAVSVDRLAVNPYSKLKGRFSRGEKENVGYLTESEMEVIRNLKLLPGCHLDMCRDLFVVQMFTGMAYADLMKFDINDYRLIDGEWRTNSDRVKTGVAYVSMLLPPVVDVLEKYNWKLPKLSNQKYNAALKQIGVIAGIRIPLHSHLARHTFATYMLNNGVNLENLQRMLGHAKLEMTRRYAKTLASSVNADFDKIAKKLKKG